MNKKPNYYKHLDYYTDGCSFHLNGNIEGYADFIIKYDQKEFNIPINFEIIDDLVEMFNNMKIYLNKFND